MQPIVIFVAYKTLFTVLHVLSVVLGMGAALVGDLLFGFYSRDKLLEKTEKQTLELISKIVLVMLVVIILTGICLFLSAPVRYMQSDKFISKMILMVLLLVNGYVLNHFIHPKLEQGDLLTSPKERRVRQLAFTCGAISVSTWITICCLGVLKSIPITYVSFVSLYAGFLVFAIACALVVEYVSFEKIQAPQKNNSK